MPVAMLTATTAAPGVTPPAGSLTRPVMLAAAPAWAWTSMVELTAKTTTKATKTNMRRVMPSLLENGAQPRDAKCRATFTQPSSLVDINGNDPTVTAWTTPVGTKHSRNP